MPGWLAVSEFRQKHKYRIQGANDLLSMVSGLLLLLFITADQSTQIQSRRYMVSEIEMTALLTGFQTGLFKVDPRVLRAVSLIPREEFVSPDWMNYAYRNVALPLDVGDHRQAEPFLIAMMVHLMDIGDRERVLDIGYGNGYSTAIMSRLAGQVYSVHQTDPGSLKSAHYFRPLEDRGYTNVTTRKGDGALGWKEQGPFDAILVKQSMPEVPAALLGQLKPYGRLVIPIGAPGGLQRLMVYHKLPDGTVISQETLAVRITPLITGQDA